MRIKEVSQLLGFSPESIRYFEKLGVLSPSRQKNNAYREYSEEDIFHLMYMAIYHKMGFSIRDAAKFAHTQPLKAVLSQFEGRLAALNADLRRKTLLAQAIRQTYERLKTDVYNVGNFWFESISEQRYFLYMDSTLDGDEEVYHVMEDQDVRSLLPDWIQHFPFVQTVQVIEPHSISSATNGTKRNWGLLLPADYAEEYGLPMNEAVKTIPAGHCLRSVIEAERMVSYSDGQLSAVLSYLEGRGLHPSGPCTVFYQSAFTDESGERHLYEEICIPI